VSEGKNDDGHEMWIEAGLKAIVKSGIDGMRVEIVSWKRSLSKELAQESSKNVVLLDDLRTEIEKAAADTEVEQLMTPEDAE